MDKTHAQENITAPESEIIKSSDETEITRDQTQQKENLKSPELSDQTLKNQNLFVDANTDVQIKRIAEVPPHRFASKSKMKRKLSTKEKIKKNPFAMLARQSRITSSKEMKRIKDSLSKLENLMSRDISQNLEEFQKEQQERLLAYNELIENCELYINTKNPRTKNGNQRLDMVKGISERCKHEFDSFKAESENAYNEVTQGSQKSWYSVLTNIQTENSILQEKAERSLADSDYDFISERKLPIEVQLLKSSEDLIAYRDNLLKSGKKIDSEVKNWLNTHIRHWEKIEYLREHKPTNKPQHILTIKRNGNILEHDDAYEPMGDDEVVLNHVNQVGYQSHSNSCWSRVGQTLLNYQGVDIDQTQIRAFRKSGLDKYNYNSPEGSKCVFSNDFGSLDLDAHELLLQVTENMGMEIRQYGLDPKNNNKITQKAMQNGIMAEVKRVILERKVPIAFLYNNHYLTIVGFKGNTLLVKDPKKRGNHNDSDSIREYNIKSINGNVSLEWLQELTFEENGQCREILAKQEQGGEIFTDNLGIGSIFTINTNNDGLFGCTEMFYFY